MIGKIFAAGWHLLWRPPLYQRVIAGVAVGLALGLCFGNEPYLGGLKNEHLAQIAQLIIRLLKALATPLIVLAVVDSLAKTNISGRHGGKLLFICLVNVSVAFAIGLSIMNVARPGERWLGHTDELLAAAGAPAAVLPPGFGTATLSPLENLAAHVPESLAEPFVKNDVLAAILLAILAGAALRYVRRAQLTAGQTAFLSVEQFVETAYQMLMQMLLWIVELAPFAVAGALAATVGKHGLAVLDLLKVFLFTMLAGLALHSLVYYPLAAWLVGRKSPRVYLGRGADAVITGLSTNSSLATVPVTLRCLERMGVSSESARLSACVGTNFNNDGITLYEAMAALFLAQALGYRLDIGQQLIVVASSIMAAVGIAGIPEAGIIVLPLVLSAAGLDSQTIVVVIPLLLTVDWIIARARSGVNVLADMLVAILLDVGRRPSAAAADGTRPAG